MASDDSFYRPPGSALDLPSEGSRRSLDDAVNGRFEFDISETLSEAWALTSGSKAVILGAVAIMLAVSIVNAVISGVAETSDSVLLSVISILIGLAANAIIYSLNAGVFLYAIKRAAGDQSAAFDDVLSGFGIIVPVFLLTMLSGILVVLGMFLFILPGIYLLVGYSLALPLKAERGLGIWDCLETSRKAITTNWFKFFAFNVSLGLLVLIGSALSLGIGLIWLIPFWALSMGILYRQVFGYEPGPA